MSGIWQDILWVFQHDAWWMKLYVGFSLAVILGYVVAFVGEVWELTRGR